MSLTNRYAKFADVRYLHEDFEPSKLCLERLAPSVTACATCTTFVKTRCVSQTRRKGG